MRKLVFLLVATMLLGMMSCNKDKTNPPETGSVELSITSTDFKSVGDSVPECTDLEWSYAKYVINGDTVKAGLITMANGIVNTEALQYDVGFYTITFFSIYNDNGTVDESDDILVQAAPLPGSLYYDLVTNKLDIELEVVAFKKAGYVIDVLCYEPAYFDEFGFIWLITNEIIVREICIFGDVCTADPALYDGSLYENQENGLQMDMPAIFEALIYKDGILQSTFSNESWYGEGECLKVHWADDLDLPESFYIVIKTLLPVGTGFDYVTTDSIPFTDEGSDLVLGDGVLIFQVGNCSGTPVEYTCSAWINLPTEPFTFMITASGGIGGNPWIPATMGTYFDYTFSDVEPGYAVGNGDYPGWCGDKYHGIIKNQLYNAQFISSVTPLPPGFYLTSDQAGQLNWIFNHLTDYFPTVNVEDWIEYGTGFTAQDWAQIQWAIWGVTDGVDLSGPDYVMAQQIASDAASHSDYEPLPDEYGIVFVLLEGIAQLQLVLLYC